MIQLKGEQLRILQLPLKGPVLIKGSAGSGKTTLAVARAQHLANSVPDLFGPNSVGVFTYTNPLVNFVATLIGTGPQNRAILVKTFHSFAYRFIRLYRRGKVATVLDNERLSIISSVLSSMRLGGKQRIFEKPVDFFSEEIRWLKGRRILDLDTYVKTPRTGRGHADKVTMSSKQDIWQVFEHYRKRLADSGSLDFDDYALVMLDIIDSDVTFAAPFTHVVVDEAQDLSQAQLLAISKLVKPEHNSISLVADTAQMIYRSGFSWSALGFQVRGGRSVELKINYRNTRQIAEAALSLLQKEGSNDYTIQILPTREGPKPRLMLVPRGQTLATVMGVVSSFVIKNESCVVLHRSRKGLGEVHGYISKHLPVTRIERRTKTINPGCGLYATTMHSVKGLEFDHVVLVEVNEGVIPSLSGVDTDDVAGMISVERNLLYTSMTRARLTLTLIASEHGKSRLIDDIAQETLETITP
jgi:superfamily I DNA/RNA helicase